jgi:uncharacterized protein (TIGR02646 family)
MRKVALAAAPDVLDGPDSIGGQEIAAAIAFFADDANDGKTFDFSAYKNPAVKAAINAAFFFKCAYCESSYAATAPVDVEHYRPKAAVNVDGKKKPPGYYWLAAKWSNMLASCIFCNRENKQVMPDGTTRTTGKGNNFPLTNEAKRAKEPKQESKEGRLLLNPYLDDPAKHLDFDAEGIVRPHRSGNGRMSRKGQTSIDVYGLIRSGLVQDRRRLGTDIAARIQLIENLMAVHEQNPNPLLKTTIGEEMAKLKGRMEPDQPYSEMARQLIEPFLRTMSP